ncbi:MAG: c-type cytochrome, partial [Pseudomonadota bacterium]
IQFARKCSVCHTLTPDGANRAGPTLHKIFGRKIATHKGYRFSEPLKKLDIVWTPETVSKLFELGPDVFTPGSKMPLQKMTDPKQRDALIAFLKQATEPSSRNASGSN